MILDIHQINWAERGTGPKRNKGERGKLIGNGAEHGETTSACASGKTLRSRGLKTESKKGETLCRLTHDCSMNADSLVNSLLFSRRKG